MDPPNSNNTALEAIWPVMDIIILLHAKFQEYPDLINSFTTIANGTSSGQPLWQQALATVERSGIIDLLINHEAAFLRMLLSIAQKRGVFMDVGPHLRTTIPLGIQTDGPIVRKLPLLSCKSDLAMTRNHQK